MGRSFIRGPSRPLFSLLGSFDMDLVGVLSCLGSCGMDGVGVFVDAGYVFAAGSNLVTGEKLTRGAITLDHAAVAKELTAFATRVSGLPVLRIYWYDGTSTGPTAQHI